MLKINHPAAIVRDRQKPLNWESVRLYKYANGVELQILVGHLPHGELQSCLSSNRALKIDKQGADVTIDFTEEAAPLLDFLNGDRPTGEAANVIVLDPCRFLPSVKVAVKAGDETAELAPDGQLLVASFKDGTRVEVEPHGGHGHVHAKRGETGLKCFFNGKDNVLYVLGEEL